MPTHAEFTDGAPLDEKQRGLGRPWWSLWELGPPWIFQREGRPMPLPALRSDDTGLGPRVVNPKV